MVRKHHHHRTNHHGGDSSAGSAHHPKKDEESDEKRQQKKMFQSAYNSAPVKQVLVAASTVEYDRQPGTSGAHRRHDVIEKGPAPQKASNPVDQIIAAAIATERARQRQQQGSSGVRNTYQRGDDVTERSSSPSHNKGYADEYSRVKMVKPTRYVVVEERTSTGMERRQHKIKPDKRFYE